MVLNHQHFIARIDLKSVPERDRNLTRIEAEWFYSDKVEELVSDIGMNLMLPPLAAYSQMEGNIGCTVVAIITTSHIALHVWDDGPESYAQLDIYSCKEFDSEVIIAWITDVFKDENIKDVSCVMLDRNYGVDF